MSVHPEASALSSLPAAEAPKLGPSDYLPEQMISMLHVYMGENPVPVTASQLMDDENLRSRSGVFLDWLFSAAEVLREQDTRPVVLDVQAARLRLAGEKSRDIIPIVFPDADPNMSQKSAALSSRVKDAVKRLVSPLHALPGYEPHNIHEMYQNYMSSTDETLPALPDPPAAPPRRPSRPYLGTVTFDEELDRACFYLSKAGLELSEAQLQTLGRRLLYIENSADDALRLTKGIPALHERIAAAAAYRPNFKSKVFNQVLAQDESDTSLLRSILDNGRPGDISRALRAKLIEEIRRVSIIPTPDVYDPQASKLDT